MSLSLARKYRPKNFASVAVQSHVSRTLRGAVARGRVANGYLLCGPRGVGKTTLARVLAMALNCERRDPGAAPELAGEPCGECTSCTRIWAGSASLDVVEIDAASNRGVDDARELRERAMYAPSASDRYKVYIIDEAHMLTREAWNALLKILEEPPPRVVFVFATTEPQKILQLAAPVLSRLQRFDLKRVGVEDIRARLMMVLAAEHVEATDAALAMLSRAADGSLRDALSLADQVLSLGDETITADRVSEALGLVAEDEYLSMLDIVGTRRAADVFPAVERLSDAGVDLGVFLAGFADMVRALLTVVLGGEPASVSESGRAALHGRRELLASGDLVRMLTWITELEPRFRRSGQQQLLLETLLVRFALIDRTVEIETLIRGLGTGASRGEGGGQRAENREQRGESRERPRSNRAEDAAPPAALPVAAAPAPAAAAVAPSAAPSMGAAPVVAVGEQAVPAKRAAAPEAPRPAVAQPERPRPPANPAESLQALSQHWGAVTEYFRAKGRVMLAAAFEHGEPTAVAPDGQVTITIAPSADLPFELVQNGVQAARDDVLAAVRAALSVATSVVVRSEGGAAPAPATRVTAESIRKDRVAQLRKRDPVLGAAIDALDLELME